MYVDKSDIKSCLFWIIFVALLIVGLAYLVNYNYYNNLSKDGFVVVEQHSTYDLAKKNNHYYMISHSVYGGIKIDHSPECPCND